MKWIVVALMNLPGTASGDGEVAFGCGCIAVVLAAVAGVIVVLGG